MTHQHSLPEAPIGERNSALRLIQDSAIDLVKPILSCNDQSSIKIAE